MKLPLLLLLSLCLSCSQGYKILFAMPKWMYSHMNFIGNIADILVEGGHDVTMLQYVVAPLNQSGTKLAKVVDFQPGPEVFQILVNAEKSGAIANVWKHSVASTAAVMFSVDMIGSVSYHNTKALLNDQKFLDGLKSEKYDIGITELFDFTGVALFNAIGLKNIIGAHSTGILEGTNLASGTPLLPAFTPGAQTHTDDGIGIVNRFRNLVKTYWGWRFQTDISQYAQKAVNEKFGKAVEHDIWKTVQNITWFLVNQDPIFDFPKAFPTNIVEIQGIGVPVVKPLSEDWSEILSRRSKNVLVSFGSIANPTTMPENVRKAIISALASIPDVTFIWKFDLDDDPMLADAPNVVVTKWMPQNDLLADSRITAFLTHGGVGSLLEALGKGIPLIAVPIFGDQPRNVQIAKHHGAAVIFDKLDLGNSGKLAAAIKEVLDKPEYKKNAVLLSQILATKWNNPRQNILNTIEFAGRFGLMPRFQSPGRHLNLIQYFNLDILIIFVITVVLILTGVVLLVRRLVFSAKEKME